MCDNLAGIRPDVIERFGFAWLPFDHIGRRPNELMSLAGKRALVPGGGDLGQAIVHWFAALGAQPEPRRESGDPKLLGVGISCYVEDSAGTSQRPPTPSLPR